MVDAGSGVFKAIGRKTRPYQPIREPPKGLSMTNEDTQKAGKAAMDMTLNAFGVWSKGAQAIATEVIGYAKKSAESSAQAWEKLVGAKSLESAFEVQSQYARSAYEDFVAETAKLGELYVEFAREAYAPLRTAFGEASTRA
jgi:phasin family protein